MFGMHANANIAFQLQETRTLVDTVLSIQPRVGGGGDGGSGGNSTDATVAALAQQILQELPADLDPGEAASGLHDRAPDGKLNSLSVVLSQEVERWVGCVGSGVSAHSVPRCCTWQLCRVPELQATLAVYDAMLPKMLHTCSPLVLLHN